jgi:hypothetical protein
MTTQQELQLERLFTARASLPTLNGKPVGSIRHLSEVSGRSSASIYIAILNKAITTHELPGFGKCILLDDLVAHISAPKGRPKKTTVTPAVA